MAKKNAPQTFVNPETGETITVKPKKKKTWLWILLAVVVVIAVAANAGNKKAAPDNDAGTEKNASEQSGQSDAGAAEAEPAAPDFSDVETVYTLTAGQYYAGIDIPCGKFNLTALSGDGNVMTTNMYTGGVNGMFGGPEADRQMYKESYNGIKLPKGEALKVWGDLTVRIEYVKVDAGFTGRAEDTANKITLTAGNYDIGEDVPAGLYTVRVTEGSGNISCNVYGGGLNEVMGAPGTDNSILVYIPEFKNALLTAGETLQISNMTVELIPMVPGADG